MSEPLQPIINGRSRLVGVMGWPVQHSLSPVMHNASLAKQGLEAVYIPLSVAPEHVAEAVRGLVALGFVGCNVTIPHKLTVLPLMDQLTDEAELIGAVNTIRIEPDGSLTGHNTDCHGAVRAMERAGTELKGRRVLIIGAGGAGRAVAAGAALAGASDVIIANRTEEKAEALCKELSSKEALRQTNFEATTVDRGIIDPSIFAEVTAVFQLSSLGMKNNPGIPLDPVLLPDNCHALESIYSPLETDFLRECRKRGLRTTDGLAMLLEQGAISYEFWFGNPADRDVMRAALESSIS